MDYSYFIQGYILGISVASTIGISGILCLQNMMTGRISMGISSALAASLADMSCAMLVVFGLRSGQAIFLAYKTLFHVVTGIFLCCLGVSKLMSKMVWHSGHRESGGVLVAFFSVFFLSVVDPISILDFIGLCMGLTLDFSIVRNAATFVLGLFVGSATWWLGLCAMLLYFRANISVVAFERIQQCVGVGIILFGFWTLKMAWQGV